MVSRTPTDVRSGRSRGVKLLVAGFFLASLLSLQVATPTAAGAYPLGQGFWLAGEDGGVFAFGEAQYFGSAGAVDLAKPVVGIAAVPFYEGYWLAGEDGGIFAYGSASFMGSVPGALGPGRSLEEPIFNIAASASGLGYWMVAADGGVFAFGDARYFGATTEPSIPDANAPMTDIDGRPTNQGYWTVSANGGVYAFGDAPYLGSLTEPGGPRANAPILAIEGTPSGNGYYLTALDGAVYAFGDAKYEGAMNEPGRPALAGPVVGIAVTPTGNGYRLTSTDGGVYSFGDAQHFGSATGLDLKSPIVGIDTRPPFSVKVDAFPDDDNSFSDWTAGGDPALRLMQTEPSDPKPAGARVLGVEGITVDQLGGGARAIGFTVEGTCLQDGDLRFVLSARDSAGTSYLRTYGCDDAMGANHVYRFDPRTDFAEVGAPALLDSYVVNSLDIIYDGGPALNAIEVDDIFVADITVHDWRVFTRAG